MALSAQQAGLRIESLKKEFKVFRLSRTVIFDSLDIKTLECQKGLFIFFEVLTEVTL